MKTSDFDYELPQEYIAQHPIEPRDASRLLVLGRQDGDIEHAFFKDVGHYLNAGDVLVLNETRVIPARLYGNKVPSGGRVEILLLRQVERDTWEVLVGGKGLMEGRKIQIAGEGGLEAEVVSVLNGSRRLVRFAPGMEAHLAEVGHVPLPPYIHARLADPERYQTVYARETGSAAAPTAGLHFTPRLLTEMQLRGLRIAKVTLHVGLDTFAPVTEENPETHPIHTEWCQLTEETANLINLARKEGRKVVAVGTTSVRTLESATRLAGMGEMLAPYEGPTSLFILPGYRFRSVDMMITNFHLPRSTLIMLVSAFAGRENILAAYEEAKREGYRFYSFGDAMLIR